MRDTLSAHNIECHHQWVGVVGAVVGRDDAAIRDGMRSVLSGAGGHDAFLRRIRLERDAHPDHHATAEDLSLYSDGGFVISIANVGSKLAICLQHLSGGSAC